MKYSISFYINGKKTKSWTTKTNFDYDWYEKTYQELIDRYADYKVISECQSGCDGYTILFNEEELISVCISYKEQEFTDFIDADGDYIIADKQLYKSETDNDVYQINGCSFGLSDEHSYYLRNIYKRESRIVEENGRCFMSSTVPDKYNFTQEDIDSLKLKKIKK